MEEPRVTGQLIHGQGLTDVRMEKKRQIVCSGHDCTLFFYEDSVEGDSYTFDVDGVEAVTAVAPYKQGDQYMVAIATKEHTVVTYSYLPGNPNDDPDACSAAEGMLFRFTAPVTCVSVSSDDQWVAAGASDFQLKLAPLSDLTKVSQLHGHEAPILWVDFDPQTEYLASSSCDGSVRVWSIKSKEQVFMTTVTKKCNNVSLATCLCRLAWRPRNDGQETILAVPAGKEVKLFEREGEWECIATLTDTHHKKDISVCCWSHCGRYLAVGGADGHVTIWEHISNAQTTCVKRCRTDDTSNITAMCWDPLGKEKEFPLIFSTFAGKLGAFPREWVCPASPSNTVSKQPLPDDDDPLVDDSLLMEGIPPDDIFSMDDVSEDMAVTAAASHDGGSRESGGEDDAMPVIKRRRLDVSGSDDEVEHSKSRSASPWEQTPSSNQIAEPAPRPPQPPSFSDKLIEVYHEAVQPSATPSYLQHRFMVYNMVGAVRCHSDSDSTSLLEVEFHSSTTHHSFSVSNHSNFSMAALSTSALVLASERSYDEPSVLQVTHFSSWSSAKEWSMQMPGKESVEVVAVGSEWLAVATNKQYLRVFSLGGIQKEVLSLPGRIVTMAGWRNQLAIVYQTAPCTETVFSLHMWVLDIHRQKVVHSPHTLPVTPHAKLEWVGFSEGGLLLSYDTKGVVRALSTSYHLSWQPVLDCARVLGNSKCDHYFIVGMTHNPAEMRVILCKGLDYPPVLPRPVMSSLPLKVPLCEPQTEKTETEDKFQQLLLRPPALPSSDSDLLRPLIQMLALACRSNQEYRAYEVAAMMPTEQGLELALQYATKSGHHRLAREINELQQQKALQDDEDDEEEEEEEDMAVDNDTFNHFQSVRTNSHQNFSDSLSSSSMSSRMKLVMARRRQKERERAEMSWKSQEQMKENKEEVKHEELEEEEKTKDIGSAYEDEDQTKELFSDEDEKEKEAGKEEEEEELKVGDSPVVMTNERYNPFKMATPQRKKVEANRRSSFLENIRKEAEREEEKKKEKQQKQKGTQSVKPSKRKKSDGGKLKEVGSGPKPKSALSTKTNTTQKLSAFSFTKKQ